MPLVDAGRNACLTGGLGNAITHVSIHSSNPGTAGDNELSGGSPAHARKAVTWNTVGSGQRTNNGALAFDIPAGSTAAFAGFWSALTVGTFYGWAPLGGYSPQVGTVEADDDYITSKGHGLADTDMVVVYDVQAAGLPTGLTEGTIYYVISSATDQFKVSATSGGASVAITGDGELVVQRILPEVFAGQGTLTIADATLSLDARFV